MVDMVSVDCSLIYLFRNFSPLEKGPFKAEDDFSRSFLSLCRVKCLKTLVHKISYTINLTV